MSLLRRRTPRALRQDDEWKWSEDQLRYFEEQLEDGEMIELTRAQQHLLGEKAIRVWVELERMRGFAKTPLELPCGQLRDFTWVKSKRTMTRILRRLRDAGLLESNWSHLRSGEEFAKTWSTNLVHTKVNGTFDRRGGVFRMLVPALKFQAWAASQSGGHGGKRQGAGRPKTIPLKRAQEIKMASSIGTHFLKTDQKAAVGLGQLEKKIYSSCPRGPRQLEYLKLSTGFEYAYLHHMRNSRCPLSGSVTYISNSIKHCCFFRVVVLSKKKKEHASRFLLFFARSPERSPDRVASPPRPPKSNQAASGVSYGEPSTRPATTTPMAPQEPIYVDPRARQKRTGARLAEEYVTDTDPPFQKSSPGDPGWVPPVSEGGSAEEDAFLLGLLAAGQRQKPPRPAEPYVFTDKDDYYLPPIEQLREQVGSAPLSPLMPEESRVRALVGAYCVGFKKVYQRPTRAVPRNPRAYRGYQQLVKAAAIMVHQEISPREWVVWCLERQKKQHKPPLPLGVVYGTQFLARAYGFFSHTADFDRGIRVVSDRVSQEQLWRNREAQQLLRGVVSFWQTAMGAPPWYVVLRKQEIAKGHTHPLELFRKRNGELYFGSKKV